MLSFERPLLWWEKEENSQQAFHHVLPLFLHRHLMQHAALSLDTTNTENPFNSAVPTG